MKQHTKNNITEFVNDVLEGKRTDNYFDIGLLTDIDILKIQNSVGLNLSGYSFSIDISAINHIYKKHGSIEKEKFRGQIAVFPKDYIFIEKVILNTTNLTHEISLKSCNIIKCISLVN